MTRRSLSALALAVFSVAALPAAFSQQTPATVTPRLDIALGYNHTQANAPPGQSGNFGMNGGFAGVDFHIKSWLAATGEFTGGHASNISALGQNLTLTTYLAGPRVQFGHHRLVPFGQALFGAAHGSDSYFPSAASYTTSATSFAYTVGGGLDFNLTHRIAIRPLEAQFLHTAFPNGSSNVQHHLLTGAGIVIKFGGRLPVPPPPVEAMVTPPRGDIHFSCSLSPVEAMAGKPLRVLGESMTTPDRLEVRYTWMPDAGMIIGTGREVALDTSGLAPGHHVLRGHAAVVGNLSMAADCELPYDIIAPVAPPAPPAPAPAPPVPEQEFHINVPDAYFSLNSAVLDSAARAAALHAADYLNSHPTIRVRVEGFADERGSVEYNLVLGEQRAEAARDALVAAGVASDRVEIISFGKARPVCSQRDESCFRQNRRAAFSLHP